MVFNSDRIDYLFNYSMFYQGMIVTIMLLKSSINVRIFFALIAWLRGDLRSIIHLNTRATAEKLRGFPFRYDCQIRNYYFRRKWQLFQTYENCTVNNRH